MAPVTYLDGLVLSAYYSVLAMLTLFALHRLSLVYLRRKHSQGIVPAPAAMSRFPSITVQLPLYNEPAVSVRALQAAAALCYQGNLRLQLLDDSTDETTALVAERAAQLQSEGIQIDHIRRQTRDGFKAGALSHGMRRSDSELFLVLDADFVAPPDLLTRMIPHFANEGVGMVQARWAHINRDHSLLTRVQAIFLDGHFAIESAARHASGRFFNFNGTAGIWRREAIESAGGWSASTLTEDLDLSYRAQLAGWKFVFLDDVEVPSELPETLLAFHGQQHRWAKGSIQTARKLLPSILSAPISGAKKIEASLHLLNNVAYLLLLMLGLLLVPAMEIRHRLGGMRFLLADTILLMLTTASMIYFYIAAQKILGRKRPRLLDLLCLTPIGIGLCVTNASAVVQGVFERGGYFNRTPKSGGKTPGLADTRQRPAIGETAMSLLMISSMAFFIVEGNYFSLPFATLFAVGFSSPLWMRRRFGLHYH
ncbi:MAG TPA: glycosyltransferase [Thermoanaerobaculia bacterium]|nr:glycosyltransferase [Thermoanaerobaculia bacterium]